MKVRLTQFYSSGLYRDFGEYETAYTNPDKHWEKIKTEVVKMRDEFKLPKGPKTTADLIILVTFPEKPDAEPFLVLLERDGSVSFGDHAHGNLVNTGTVHGDFHPGDKKSRQ